MVGFIYQIKDRFTGYFKIGYSSDPERRLRQLIKQDTLMPFPNNFELVQVWRGTKQDEANLHAILAKCRVRGEWFRLDGDSPLVIYFHCRERGYPFICKDFSPFHELYCTVG